MEPFRLIPIGSSDTATLTIQDANGSCELHMGKDGEYAALLADGTVQVPKEYRLVHSASGWMEIHDYHCLRVSIEAPEICIYQGKNCNILIQATPFAEKLETIYIVRCSVKDAEAPGTPKDLVLLDLLAKGMGWYMAADSPDEARLKVRQDLDKSLTKNGYTVDLTSSDEEVFVTAPDGRVFTIGEFEVL